MSSYLFNFAKKGAAKGKTLREQAAELVHVKMWGIGDRSPGRGSLAPGDVVLIYVGAPEYAVIGHAELASPAHEWSPAEKAQYPGSFNGGVTFSQGEVWLHPVPMKSVLPQLALKETNPGTVFRSGIARITKEDYETVVAVGTGSGPLPKSAEPVDAPGRGEQATEGHAVRPLDVELLFKTVEKLEPAAELGSGLSEYDTRAEFIDKYLEALGYVELGDIKRGLPVDSGNVPDYVLLVNGRPAIAIEAKKLGTQLGAKEAGQVVAYCSSLGVRWGAVTDGRQFKLYDAPMLGVQPEERLVFSVNLADYRDRDDFEVRICPELELLAKTELESGAGLERRVAQEAVRELLTTSSSESARALRDELDESRHIKLAASELSELVSELLS